MACPDDLPETWHYGLVARYWAEMREDGGRDADYFRTVIGTHGQPVLDAGCGAGRLLLPYLRDGLDVDGCDLSADMLAHCRDRAEAEGFSPHLYRQALHELDLPRAYRTIVLCGAIGLGGDPARDLEALRRFHRHLEPGGALALDLDVPWAGDMRYWQRECREQLPEDWPPPTPPEHRGRFSDGSELDMNARTVDFDPLSQVHTMEIRARLFRDGVQVAEEVHRLKNRVYFRDELLTMLRQAGFDSVDVRGDYTDAEPTAEHEWLVFVARKAS